MQDRQIVRPVNGAEVFRCEVRGCQQIIRTTFARLSRSKFISDLSSTVRPLTNPRLTESSRHLAGRQDLQTIYPHHPPSHKVLNGDDAKTDEGGDEGEEA